MHSESVGQVEQWFGPGFSHLHPLLQQLHRQGGSLSGPVAIHFGRHLSGWLGRRIARRMGIPSSGSNHTLEVRIHSADDGLH
jgi:hypothetical protein